MVFESGRARHAQPLAGLDARFHPKYVRAVSEYPATVYGRAVSRAAEDVHAAADR